MNCDKAHFWVVTLYTVLCTLQVHSSRLITLLLPAVLRFRGLVKPWSWSRMKSHYMRVTAALFAPYCYYAIFGIVFAWRTTSKTYASLFKIHLSFFNCFGSKASAVFKGVGLLWIGHCLLTSGLALGVPVSSESSIEETSVLCEEMKLLELLIFLTVLFGFILVSAEEDREKLGSLRM